MNEPFTTESDVEHRVITHANGDRTIVDISVTEEQATQLAQLSGDELHAAIAEHKAEADRKAEAEKTATATQAVLTAPPATAPDYPVPTLSGAPAVPFAAAPVADAPTTAEGSGQSGFPVA
jgi:hypothetical protein